MISSANYAIKPFFTFKNLNMHNFFTNFILDHSISSNRIILNSNFKNFLSSPIAIRGDQCKKITNTAFRINSSYYNDDCLTIIGCHFINCIHEETYNEFIAKGGAIEYKENANGNVTLYSSTFDNCSAPNGDGGALFICGVPGTTGETPTHGFISSFRS